ncbi:MAG: response regulator transcription factor [Chloroflexi bacterium]|nr:response regulator transcription factor [Chloroflexota bacterium]
MGPRKVLLVDDHALFRDGIASLLRAGGLEVAGQAGNGEEAIRKARDLKPDVILMDVKMPGVSGLEATRAIKTEMPEVKVVMLTVSDDEQDLFEAIKGGADGYILKDTPGDDFSELLTRLFEGEPVFSRGLAARMLSEFRRGRPGTGREETAEEELSDRELEVLQLAAGGATNKEIAARLFISESTANYHIRNILSKLHLRNRAEAAAYAARKGLLKTPS